MGSGSFTDQWQPDKPPSRRRRILLNVVIVAFFCAHGLLSLRSAVLQDDRYGWRMFHNVGSSRVKYYWVMENGRKKRFRPKKDSVVKRGRRMVIQRRNSWVATYYSDGTVRAVVEAYVEYMGTEKRIPGAKAFEAKLDVRINDETEYKTYVYRYPETPE